MRINGLRIVTFDVPLRQPLVMGSIRFESREYVIVEVRTDAGVSGVGFGMTRGAPVAALIRRNLWPHLAGEDPLLTEGLWDRMYHANLTIGQRGIFMRALSLVDIALWDLKGRAVGLPVWQLLGGSDRSAPAFVAGGYPTDDRDLDDLAREMGLYQSLGFRTVKIAGGEIALDAQRLSTARKTLGPDVELAYDAHWSWRRLRDVVDHVRSWEPFHVAFIEDPFPPELVDVAVRLREASGCSLALGEDCVGRWAFADLLARARPEILRVDATVAGGFSEAAKICALSSVDGIPVLPHVFPEIHIHLAAAYAGVIGVELTWPDEGYEGLHRAFRDWIRIEDGFVRAPEGPGLGIDVDWDALVQMAVDVVEVAGSAAE